MAVLVGWACGGTEPCSPSNCQGCCDASGQCQPGTVPTACGSSANACTACSPIQVCQLGACRGIVGTDGGQRHDAGLDAGSDAGADAGGDAGTDGGVDSGTGFDAGFREGDTCLNPTPLVFSNGALGGSATHSGTTEHLLNDETSSVCGSQVSGPDRVFSFSTSVPLTLSAILQPASPGYLPALYLHGESCITGAQVACQVSSSGSATIAVPNLASGKYFLFVDGSSSTSGAYTLAATLDPVVDGDGESCAGPKLLTLSNGSTGTTTVTGSTSGANHDRSGTCHSGAAPDRVYTFTTTQTQSITATLTPSANYDGALYLTKGSTCSQATQVSCRDSAGSGGQESLTLSSSTAGTYYLWVDGYSSVSHGSFTLSVTVQ